VITRPTATRGTLLALDGDLPAPEFIASLRDLYTAVVAADGAALALLRMEIHPDVVIGDLDGIGAEREALERAGAIVIEEPDQESGDLEKALRWIIARGENRIDIIGASGGMSDHTLNNFSILARYAPQLTLRILEQECTTWLATGRLELATSAGDRISLIPLPTALLSTTGLQWELRNERLAIGEREGASNRATAGVVTIDVSKGVVAVMEFGRGGEGSDLRFFVPPVPPVPPSRSLPLSPSPP
jgi:thiamine pyrophosphokinase